MIKRTAWIFCLMLLLSTSVGFAREPLQGSARFTQANQSTQADHHKVPAWSSKQSAIFQADALVRNYKLESAEKIYRRLLAQNPKNAAALNGVGKIALLRTQSGDRVVREQADQLYSDAIQNFLSAIRYQPGYVEAHLNLAKVYTAQKRFFLAGEAINHALFIAPGSGAALSMKGEWLLAQDQAGEALPLLQKAAKLRPNDSHTKALLAQAYAQSDQWSAAHKAVQSALAQNPKSYQNQITLGHLQAEHGNQAAAEAAFQKAVELKPESSETRIPLADFYEKRGDFRTAAEQLKSLADSTDVDWPIIDRVGKLSVKSGQPDVAVHYYRRWLNEHPDDAKAKAGLSYAKRELARQKSRNDDLISQGEAKRYAEQSLEYNRENYEARLIIAKLDREIGIQPQRVEAGMADVALNQMTYRPSQAFDRAELLLNRYQFGEARTAYRQARLSDVSARGQMVFGELLLVKGLPSLAEEAFSQVLKMLPGNTSARLGLAKAREAKEKSEALISDARENHSDLAIDQAKEALKLNAENADAYYLLARLSEAKKAYSEAADYYYAYQELTVDANEARRIAHKIDSLKRKITP